MLPPSIKVLKRVIKLSVAGTRGGAVRLHILLMLEDKVHATNEIAKDVGLDYKTIEYHLRVLEKAGLIVGSNKRYKRTFGHSNILKSNKNLIREITEELRMKVRKTR